MPYETSLAKQEITSWFKGKAGSSLEPAAQAKLERFIDISVLKLLRKDLLEWPTVDGDLRRDFVKKCTEMAGEYARNAAGGKPITVKILNDAAEYVVHNYPHPCRLPDDPEYVPFRGTACGELEKEVTGKLMTPA